MAVEQSFDELLTEKLHPELLKNEVEDRSYILKNSAKDNEWKGGEYGYGFEMAHASSIMYDGYTDENDVGEAKVARGNIASQKMLSGTMVFNHKDLISHDSGKITEASFLKILPRHISDFSMYLKSALSQNLLTGNVITKSPAAARTTDGKAKVARVDRLVIGQKVQVESTTLGLVDAYVGRKSIVDRSDLHVILYSDRALTSALDLTASAGEELKFYHPNGKSKSFSSVKQLLLSNPAEGGSATAFGLAKNEYDYLQNMEFDATVAGMTSSNILDVVFDFVTDLRTYTQSNADEVWCSFKHFGAIIKQLNLETKNYNVIPNSRKMNKFGWQEITIGSVDGDIIKFVAMKEADDDFMTVIDPKTFKFATNGLVRKVLTPDGRQYYWKRTTQGHKYFLDWEVFGEYFCTKPCENAIIKNIAL